jgi:kynurenine formamidase
LSWADVEFWEEEHGPVPQGTVVLLYTGWQEKWGDPGLYFGADASGSPHFPGFGNDAARYLLAHRGAAGLGIDTHGLEPGAAAGYPVNKLLLERPRLALENLTNLDQLPPTGATIVVGLVRLTGGSGSPVSVLAFVP